MADDISYSIELVDPLSAMKQKIYNLLKDTLIFAIGSIGSKLILFILMPIYTNCLTEAEYGISELIFSVSQLLIPFLSLVIFDAVVRFGLSKEDKPEDVLLIGMLVFLAGSVLTVAITPVIGLYDALAPWKWYLCVYIIFNMLNSITGCYLKSVDKNRLFAAVNILQTLVLAVLNIVLLVYLRAGVKGYLVSTIAASMVACLVIFAFGGLLGTLKKARFRPELLKKMVVYSAPLILNNVSWWVIHSSDKVMIELMIGSAALGIYTVATKIPSLINVIIAIFSQAWNISSVREAEGGGDRVFYSRVFLLYQVLTFGAVIGLNGIIKPFMSFYVGDSFLAAWKYIPLLLAAAAFSAVSAYFGSLYAALKKSVNNMVTTLVAAAVNIVLNYLWIERWGLWGAAFATLAAYILLSTMRMIDVRRYISVEISAVRYILNSCLIVAQAVFVALAYHIYLCSAVILVVYIAINVPALLSAVGMRRETS